jgi:predicted DNA-binding transcriptional regulator YafY
MSEEYGTKTRLLRIMRALIERPFGYTKRQLADQYGKHIDTINGDFEAFKNAGFEIQKDDQHRYAFRMDRTYQELKDILFFSEADQALLMKAIDQVDLHSKRGQRLKRKLDSLYDYHKLGFSTLRRPYLNKIDSLEQAKKEKRVVILEHYHSSNSGRISNRRVEPFHPAPADDMLHAYDIDQQVLRHFRLSRFERVQLTDQPWQYERRHIVLPTDPFRIVDANQVQVHLRFRVGAYNELIERFPQTRSYIQPDAEKDVYDFQAPVNHRFLGLSNFILGFHHQVIEILEPDGLIEHLRSEVQNMHFLDKI